MLHRQIRLLVVILGVLAYVSQTMASNVVACDSGSHSSSTYSSSTQTDEPNHRSQGAMHANHGAQHAASELPKKPNTHCCDHEQCDSTNCFALSSSGATAVGDIPLFVIQPQSNSESALVIAYQSITAQSLFKPPISR